MQRLNDVENAHILLNQLAAFDEHLVELAPFVESFKAAPVEQRLPHKYEFVSPVEFYNSDLALVRYSALAFGNTEVQSPNKLGLDESVVEGHHYEAKDGEDDRRDAADARQAVNDVPDRVLRLNDIIRQKEVSGPNQLIVRGDGAVFEFERIEGLAAVPRAILDDIDEVNILRGLPNLHPVISRSNLVVANVVVAVHVSFEVAGKLKENLLLGDQFDTAL